MNDCPNGDVRDLLPEYLHERLDAESRARVHAHLTGCADCRAELALLRDARAVLHVAPFLDLTAIEAAIPTYRAPVRRSWVGWRVAAAVTVMIAGGTSVVVMQSHAVRPDSTVAVNVKPAPVAEVPATPAPEVGTPVSVTPVAPRVVASKPVVPAETHTVPAAAPVARESRELATGGGALNDLSDGELASLLRDIESLDAVPSAEVETTPMAPIAPVAGRRGRS